MAESPEGSRLSGLARSIDALFSAPPAATVPATVSLPARDEPPPAPAADNRPLAADMFPHTQVLDALPETPDESIQRVRPPSGPTAGEPVQDFDPLLSFESPWSEPLAGVPASDAAADSRAIGEPLAVDSTIEPIAEVVAPGLAGGDLAGWNHPGHDLAAPDAVASDAAAPVSPSARDHHARVEPMAPDADGVLAAVDAWVDGDRSQRERIESLASGLRERLALDPLSDAVERLVRGAGDPPDRTYLELATAVMNPAVASRLVQRMGRERDEGRREEYRNLCRRLGLIMANGLKGALTGALEPSVRSLYCDTLLSMGPVSRPIIEAMVEDENRFLARAAVSMLGEIGGERAVQLVTSALANTDPRVRAEALHALGELGDAEAGRLTLGFLDDSDSNVRLSAAVAAGKLGLERALRPLIQLLEQEEKPLTRVQLLQALGDLGDPGAVPAIEKHASPGRFAKSSTEVRVAAYKALSQIGTPHARDLVQQAMNDKEPAVRAALRGLAREA